MLSGITGYSINIFWPVAEPLIRKCIKYSPEPYTTDDVLEKILSKDMQLWRVGANGFGVTQIEDDICWIYAYAGEDIHKYKDAWKELIPWAKLNGCNKIRLKGRKGWKRMLKDFKDHKDYLEYEL